MDADGSGVHCQDINCPFKEEKHHISLTIYIHSYSRLEGYTKTFFLREIGMRLYLNVNMKNFDTLFNVLFLSMLIYVVVS